jgi:hypothetical protein
MSEPFDSDPERNPFEYDLLQPEYSGDEAAPPPDPASGVRPRGNFSMT